MTNDNLVPEPQPSVFDAVNGVLQDEEAARRVMANPALAKGFPNGRPVERTSDDDTCACGNHHGKCGCQDDESDGSDIPIKAIDDIGRATAEDVREALHQVIDPELGIDVIDLGLVYGIEIDELGRAIITMTLTTPACPISSRTNALPLWLVWLRSSVSTGRGIRVGPWSVLLPKAAISLPRSASTSKTCRSTEFDSSGSPSLRRAVSDS